MNITNLTLIKLYFKLYPPARQGGSVASQGDHGTREDPEWTPRRLFSVEDGTDHNSWAPQPLIKKRGGPYISRFFQVTGFLLYGQSKRA